jgi:hypothetical protein
VGQQGDKHRLDAHRKMSVIQPSKRPGTSSYRTRTRERPAPPFPTCAAMSATPVPLPFSLVGAALPEELPKKVGTRITCPFKPISLTWNRNQVLHKRTVRHTPDDTHTSGTYPLGSYQARWGVPSSPFAQQNQRLVRTRNPLHSPRGVLDTARTTGEDLCQAEWDP